MSTFLEDFKLVIRQCDYSNTYKMAWSKAIVELSSNYKDELSEYTILGLKDIAEKMFKYYWDQTIYFNLFQAAPSQPPIIVSCVKEIIDLYQKDREEYKKIVFVIAVIVFVSLIAFSSYSIFKSGASNEASVSTAKFQFTLNNSNELYGCGDNQFGQQASGDTTNVTTFTKRAG